MKKCPFFNKSTEVPGGYFWECREMLCRFQIDGRCAILANYDLTIQNQIDLEKIAKFLGIKL